MRTTALSFCSERVVAYPDIDRFWGNFRVVGDPGVKLSKSSVRQADFSDR